MVYTCFQKAKKGGKQRMEGEAGIRENNGE